MGRERTRKPGNREHLTRIGRRVRYGVTPEDYDRMFAEQGGVCAICGQPETATRRGIVRSLCVDHDHTTGVVRGLLCSRCNLVLGLVRDSVAVLTLAAQYIVDSEQPVKLSH